jgi:hypothetical protein
MSAKQDLKAYVRLDAGGRVVPGSLIFRTMQPRQGRWFQIQTETCCMPKPAYIYVSNTSGDSVTVDGNTLLTAESNVYKALDSLLITAVVAAATWTLYDKAGVVLATNDVSVVSNIPVTSYPGAVRLVIAP